MGKTIRRTPVNFNIPSTNSDSIKYLDITSFGGLHITDNPLIAKPNTAEDMLNLYVDEQDALTTRPRLEKETDLFTSILASTDTLINLVSLGTKILIQYQDENTVVRLKLLNGAIVETIDLNGLTVASTKISAFERDGNIYILDGLGFKVIKSDYILYDVYNDEDTYIPTTYIGKTTNGIQSMAAYEPKNKLTSKYKKLWYWDGESSLQPEFENSIELSKNDYYKTITETSKISAYSSEWTIIQSTDVGIYLAKGGLASDYYNKICLLQIINGEFTITDLTTKYSLTNYYCILSRDGTKLLNRYSATSFKLFDLNYDNLDYTLPLSSGDASIYTIDIGSYCISNDGGTVWFSMYKTSTPTEYQVGYFEYNDSTDSYDYYRTSYSTGGTRAFKEMFYDETNDRALYSIPGELFVLTFSGSIITDDHTLISGNEYYSRKLSYDGTKFITYGNGASSVIINDLSNLTPSELTAETIAISTAINSDYWNINQDASVLYVIKFESLASELYQIDLSSGDCYKIKDLSEFTGFYTSSVSTSANYILGKIVTTLTNGYSVSSGISRYKSSSEPLLEIVYDSISSQTKEILEFTHSDTITSTNSYLLNITEYDATPNELKQITLIYTIQGDTQRTDTITDLDTNYSVQYGIGSAHLNLSYVSRTSVSLTFTPDSTHTYASIQLIVTYEQTDIESTKTYKEFDNFVRFQNNYWYYGNHNTDYYTSNNNPTYLPEYNTNSYGDDERITGYNILSDTMMVCYKENKMFIVSYDKTWNYNTESYDYYYSYTEVKGDIGNLPIGQSIIACYSEYPIQIDNSGIYSLYQLKNVSVSEHTTKQISESIQYKLSQETLTDMITLNRLYWTLFIIPVSSSLSRVYVLDNRMQEWFYWEFPVEIIGGWNKDDALRVFDSSGKIYTLETIDIINENNTDVTEYYDDGGVLITWYWKSQKLPMGTIRYSKKLLQTTFILNDTDETDEYGFNYKFKAFRKAASETGETTLSEKINYVKSTTKKTFIPRFNFLQLTLSNLSEDFDNNKLRLTGISMKYQLLEGML